MDGSIQRIRGQISIQPAVSRREQGQRRFTMNDDTEADAGADADGEALHEDESGEPQRLLPQRAPGRYTTDRSVGRADQDEVGSRLDLTA